MQINHTIETWLLYLDKCMIDTQILECYRIVKKYLHNRIIVVQVSINHITKLHTF